MNITLTQAVRISGAVQAAGATLTVDDAIGADPVARGAATNNTPFAGDVPITGRRNPVSTMIKPAPAGFFTPVYQSSSAFY